MQISVLILTHNRPDLFTRCLESVISSYRWCDVDLEVIVNNDSEDITEIYPDIVKYQYKKSDNLSDLYMDLYEQATGEYIYFLEDDDIIRKEFFESLSRYDEDIFYFNYRPYKWSPDFLSFCVFADTDCNKDEFISTYDDHNFQFSQICFKKKCLDIKDFPRDNDLHNDFKVFQRLDGSFRSINKFLYTQTIDGGDNISFSSLNKDDRWIS